MVKLFIITGGSKGMGSELAKLLAQEGHRVAVVARTSCDSHDSSIDFFACDLSEEAQLNSVIDQIFAKYRGFEFTDYVLINNAGGVTPINRVHDLQEEDVSKSLNLNLRAPIILSSKFLKHLESFSNTKTIVNVSSGVAKNPVASWSVYSAAKAGLENFSNCLSKEYGDDLWVVNFGPGVIDTGMQETIRNQDLSDFPDRDRFQRLKDEGQLRTPLQVASALAGFINGEAVRPHGCTFITVNELD